MTHPVLFHLHFNTPNVDRAANRLVQTGVPLQRRFGSVRGDSISLNPKERTPDEFRLKLQVHQYGAVNITLAPGQRPRFDHIGLCIERTEKALKSAASYDWSVRSNERRTFVMTPWNFRVEIHPLTANVVTDLGTPDEAHLEEVILRLPDAIAARDAFSEIFGTIPELRIESGEEPWIDSFKIADKQGKTQITVQSLLGN